MAIETANQKRKRGRPSLATLAANARAARALESDDTRKANRDSLPSLNDTSGNTATAARRKSGRLSQRLEHQQHPSPTTTMDSPRKVGRPRKSLDTDAPVEKETRRPGRPRKSEAPGASATPGRPRKSAGGGKGRPRKSLRLAERDTAADEADDENDARELRRSPRQHPDNAQVVEVSVEVQEATSQLRGRPKKGTQPQPAEPQAGRGKRKRPPAEQPEQEEPTEQPKKRGRRAKAQQAEAEPSPEPSDDDAPDYQHIATLTRRVPYSTIQNKWSPLDPTSIASITSILQAASRPVLLRLTNAQRHAHAQAALATVVRRLRSKLSRGMPFPPAAAAASAGPSASRAREAELSYERTVAGAEALEAQLDPLLHSADLLRRERERAARALDRDYRVLHRLAANARAEARQRRDQLRRVHALVPEPSEPVEGRGGADEAAAAAVVAPGAIFTDLLSQVEEHDDDDENPPHESDTQMLDLATQLSSHVHSVHTNLRQIDGVGAAIERARGALLARLQPKVIERVLA